MTPLAPEREQRARVRVLGQHLLHQYRAGNLKLDELVTRTYRLDEINQGYQDMRDGKNIRGVIIYDEQDW